MRFMFFGGGCEKSCHTATTIIIIVSCVMCHTSYGYMIVASVVLWCFGVADTAGVKEHLASASQKLDRALGKLALLTRSNKDSQDKGCAFLLHCFIGFSLLLLLLLFFFCFFMVVVVAQI